jgi:DnaJ-domain-containing protein 1
MPRLDKFNLASLSNPALNDKIIDFAEREAKELADLGIGILAEALKRRLARPRSRRAPPTSTATRQNGHGPPEADAPLPAGPYQVLGVAPEASDEDVERVFRERVMACHPDRTGASDDELRRVLQAIKQIREERNR